jgi:hypothetical protein
LVPGWPSSSPVLEFVPPPEIVSPAFGVMHPLHDPITVGRITPGFEVQVLLFDLARDDQILWYVFSVEGADTIAFPDPPSSVNTTALFPPGSELYIRPAVCERTGSRAYCDRFAQGGRQFDLVP